MPLKYFYQITNNLKNLLKIEFIFLIVLILLTAISLQYYNLNKKIKQNEWVNLLNNIYLNKSVNFLLDELEPRYLNKTHIVDYGENLKKILQRYRIPNSEIDIVVNFLSSKHNINNLKPKSKIEFVYDKKEKKIKNFIFSKSKTKKIFLARDFINNKFIEKEQVTNLNRRFVLKEGVIKSSLYKSATKLEIQPAVIVEFARIYGFQVDFQRDIRKNDTFQILYEVLEDENGKYYETGNIIFADLNLRGQSNSFYYFGKKGSKGHYDLNGKSVKKALMKTPINGARLSSPFGMRKHPIDGFNKMHQGTDFAAPEGTPIMASGDGIVVRARWCGGGGNCIKIKHNSSYSTVYAHMSKFAGSIREGVRVKQGQIIGYVGSTGKSTGPHLHYEVIYNGKKVNSQTLKLPSGKILKNKDRELFEINKIKIDVLKSEIIAKS